MKVYISILFLFSILSVSSQIELNWKFLHPIKKEWLDAGTFGSVQEKLINSGELPDPFFGLNESKFDWIENYEWEFKTLFEIDSLTYTKNKIELILPCVDTYAKLFLNDSLILETANAFLPYQIQIKDLVKKGKNTLYVIFTPPTIKHKLTAIETGIYYPAPNDVGIVQVAPLVRKPQYQFGWDWTMRMNTLGFLKPVKIQSYDHFKMKSTLIELIDLKSDTALMSLKLKLSENINGKYILESKYVGSLQEIDILNGEVNFSFEIPKPLLWWPRGQGEQNIYEDKLVLKTNYGKVIDSTYVQFGIRKSELIQEKDSIGTSYYFKINERPIFCKGANMIPMDVFPSRVTKDKIESLVKQMVSSNFNIVRIWGGGYYPEDFFYELCDKYGIMVWQDCMFACAMYPSDATYIDNVKKELAYQIPRIASHPCVIQFNGNNEVDVAWNYWGFQDKFKINEENQKQILKDYQILFKKEIPELIHSFTSVPYIHTSPLGHWINEEDFPNGTQHYWGVWHGKDPIEDFGKKSGRFNAEYGFQSFPEYSTLKSFSNYQEWNLNSEVMKSHQKSYVGNGMIKKHADLLYGKTNRFDDFVYYSQLTQAKAVGIAISANRLLSPICMGTIYWQLNDCWPAPTWSSIDYYGNWKALQYRAKEDYREVTILEKTQKIGRETYFFVSDAPDTFSTNLKYEVYNLYGKKIASEIKNFKVYNGVKYPVFKQNILPVFLKSNYLVRFEWKDLKGNICRREFTHIGNKNINKKALRSQFNVEINSIDTLKKTGVLKINSAVFINDLWITSYKKGVFFEDNFVAILPGVREIKFQFDTIPVLKDLIFKWR